MRVAEAPEKGRANDAVERAVASALSIPRRDVALESGERSREKRLRIVGLDRRELDRRLAPLVESR